ncbi:MAG: hypothetical protein KAJ44_06745 [Thermoplasmatales archaeon]|nr:hypothetical protein [Thermoplasmatales archaeon]
MDKDKIFPFTELDHEQMMEFRKDIFTTEFMEAIDCYENELSDDDIEIKRKILDFMLDLYDNEEYFQKRKLVLKPMLYGLHAAMLGCYWGINKFMEGKDKVK